MSNGILQKLREKDGGMNACLHHRAYDPVKHPYIYASNTDFRMIIDE